MCVRLKRNPVTAMLRVNNRGSRANTGRPGGRPLESSNHWNDGGLIKVVQSEVIMVRF